MHQQRARYLTSARLTDTQTVSICHSWCINTDGKLTCRVSFLSLLCCSRLSISSGGMGSPEQVWGWALCAGLPGPFLVLSSFLHLARLFWNQTWQRERRVKNMLVFTLVNSNFGEISDQSIESITVKFSLALLCAGLIVSNSCGMHFLWGKNSMIYRNFVKLKPCFSPGVTAPVLITK